MEAAAEELSNHEPALEENWGRLATVIDDASLAKAKAQESPRLLSDPWIQAQVRYLDVFGHELAAVQILYEAQDKLSAGTKELAMKYGAKLIEIADKAKEITRSQIQS